MRVAELAHLELSEAEVEMFRSQLDEILEYVEKLNQLDTTAVEPMAGGRPAGITLPKSDVAGGRSGISNLKSQISEEENLREDVPWPIRPIEPAEALRAAPDAAPATSAAGGPGFFRVPKVVERG